MTGLLARFLRQAANVSTGFNRNIASLNSERFEKMTPAMETDFDRLLAAAQNGGALFGARGRSSKTQNKRKGRHALKVTPFHRRPHPSSLLIITFFEPGRNRSP